jgi:hypothetical protein
VKTFWINGPDGPVAVGEFQPASPQVQNPALPASGPVVHSPAQGPQGDAGDHHAPRSAVRRAALRWGSAGVIDGGHDDEDTDADS